MLAGKVLSSTARVVLALQLCGLASVAYGSSLSEHNLASLKAYFGCEPCSRKLCPPLSPHYDQCELVTEPGVCGCCEVCARPLGAPCGSHTEPCGSGLRCAVPSHLGLSAMLAGKGKCVLTTNQVYSKLFKV